MINSNLKKSRSEVSIQLMIGNILKTPKGWNDNRNNDEKLIPKPRRGGKIFSLKSFR